MPSTSACGLGRAFGNDDSGRTDTVPPIQYNEAGQLFHRLATPTD